MWGRVERMGGFWLMDSTGLIQDYVVVCTGVEHCGSGEAALHFFVDRKDYLGRGQNAI